MQTQSPDDGFNAILQKYNYQAPASAGQPKDWYQQVQEKANPVQDTTTAPPATDTPFNRASQDVNEAGSKVYDQITGQGDATGQGSVQRGVGATETAFNAVPKVASEYLPEPARRALTDIGNGLGHDVNGIAETINKIPGFTDLVNAHPDTVSKLMTVLGTLSSGGNIATTILGADAGAKGLQAGVDAVAKAPGAISDAASSVKNAVVEPGQNELQQINEKITPKPTAKEARLAMDQGRLVAPGKPGLLTEGRPGGVATSEAQANSARTIQKNIPGAAQMDEPTLYSALDEQIGTKAKQLAPKMEAAPLTDETLSKITDDMENLKKTQISEAKATDEPNIAKWQNNFEKIVTKNIKDGGNLNDIWNAAKEYDSSIKSNVKTATELSPEDLQTQKDVWLENRAILRSALTDASSGLGGDAKTAFQEMRDMYEAQRGLISKAKIETTGAPSKLSQLKNKIKEHPVASTAAALGADKVIKRVTGVGF